LAIALPCLTFAALAALSFLMELLATRRTLDADYLCSLMPFVGIPVCEPVVFHAALVGIVDAYWHL
jgi:hypothetical protein